jgi:TonB family protein
MRIFRQATLGFLLLTAMTTALAQDQPTPSPTPQTDVIRRPYFLSKLIHHEIPIYPEEAKATNASGPVAVEITVDENGNALAAHAVSGPPVLFAAAERAALKCKWEPLTNRQPTRATGTLTFNFPSPDEKPIRRPVTLPAQVFSDKVESRLLKKLDQTPDTEIKYTNKPDAPVAITAARIRLVAPEAGSIKVATADPPFDYHAMSAWVSLNNNSQKRVTGALLEFESDNEDFFVRSSNLSIKRGGTDDYHIVFMSLPYAPNSLAVSVVGLAFADGSNWGAFTYWPSPTKRSEPVRTIVDTRPLPIDEKQLRTPMYTEDARRNGVMGRISLALYIDETGSVTQIKINNALPDSLTDEALRLAYEKKYQPATKGGAPVGYWLTLEFHMDGIEEIYRRPF